MSYFNKTLFVVNKVCGVFHNIRYRVFFYVLYDSHKPSFRASSLSIE